MYYVHWRSRIGYWQEVSREFWFLCQARRYVTRKIADAQCAPEYKIKRDDGSTILHVKRMKLMAPEVPPFITKLITDSVHLTDEDRRELTEKLWEIYS